MTEAARYARNIERLNETHPVFRARLRGVLTDLDSSGYRPRIQQAWRSPAEQMAAYKSGHSKLKWGFHNATSPNGTPEALAVDLVDDDVPLDPRMAFIIATAHFARRHGLDTGIEWGLPAPMRTALRAAVATNATWIGKIGWDPLHIEWVGLSVAAARAGQRPVIST